MNQGPNEIADELVESLMRLPPLLRSKLLRPLAESLGGEISHHHFLILKILEESGPQPVSGVARCALLSRPELTLISERLVELGFADRRADEADRRITILSVTDKGRQFLKDTMARTRRILRGRLSGLTPEELRELAVILTRLAELAAKIE